MKRIGFTEVAAQSRAQVTHVKQREAILILTAGLDRRLSCRAYCGIPGVLVYVEAGAVANQSGCDETTAQNGQDNGE
jgi:hypothetical protein